MLQGQLLSDRHLLLRKSYVPVLLILELVLLALLALGSQEQEVLNIHDIPGEHEIITCHTGRQKRDFPKLSPFSIEFLGKSTKLYKKPILSYSSCTRDQLNLKITSDSLKAIVPPAIFLGSLSNHS